MRLVLIKNKILSKSLNKIKPVLEITWTKYFFSASALSQWTSFRSFNFNWNDSESVVAATWMDKRLRTRLTNSRRPKSAKKKKEKEREKEKKYATICHELSTRRTPDFRRQTFVPYSPSGKVLWRREGVKRNASGNWVRRWNGELVEEYRERSFLRWYRAPATGKLF